jgi:unsaturated rhamnogalacturonyl hydrolase
MRKKRSCFLILSLCNLLVVLLTNSLHAQTPEEQEKRAAAILENTKNPGQLELSGIEGVWSRTAKGKYYKYLQQTADAVLNKEGEIQDYTDADFQDARYGQLFLLLYKVSGQQKYYKAATRFWSTYQEQKSTAKDHYTDHALEFIMKYAALVQDKITLEETASELLKRGKQSSKEAAAYAVTLVDALENLSSGSSLYRSFTSELQRMAILAEQDQAAGKSEIVKTENRDLLAYCLAKAVRLGYIKPAYFKTARKAYRGKLLPALNEMLLASLPKPGLGKTVVLDSYFNNETRKDQSGNEVSWHYKWEELANGGFSMWGGQFNNAGFKTSTLYAAPTAENLKKASAYIIVDPDTEKETKDPKYILPEYIQSITDWVKAGGVLVLMANDTGNVELEHFNHLAKAFGVQFNLNSKGRVINNNYPQGEIRVAADNLVLKKAKQLYIKEYSSLKLLAPARSVLKDKDGDDVMAVSKLGKGSVFIIGDPWLYNEYVDGRKLPAAYDNFTAGADLVNWIAEQETVRKR